MSHFCGKVKFEEFYLTVEGRIKESDDQFKSLRRDRKTTAKTKVKPGYGIGAIGEVKKLRCRK